MEREALAAEFITTSLQMYLLGAPKFQFATDLKPSLALFNNPTIKLSPPRKLMRQTSTSRWFTFPAKATWQITCGDTHRQRTVQTIRKRTLSRCTRRALHCIGQGSHKAGHSYLNWHITHPIQTSNPTLTWELSYAWRKDWTCALTDTIIRIVFKQGPRA